MKKLFYLIICLLVCSCNKNQHSGDFACPNHSSKNIKYKHLEIETVDLPEMVNSTVLLSELYDNAIYFADQQQRLIFAYMPEQDSLRKVLGYGNGPHEFEGDIDAITMNNKGLFIQCSEFVALYKIDESGWFSLVDEYIIPRKNAKDVEIVANPDKYTFTYDKLRCREHNDTLYITAGGNSPDFNIYSPNYFASAGVIKAATLSSKPDAFILGSIPTRIGTEAGRHCFNRIDFDIDPKNNFHILYELDDMIYACDNNFVPKFSYGYKGKDMDKSEHRAMDFETYKKQRDAERKKAHYRKIKCVGDYTFRSYVKSISAPYDGLQIYNGTTLIADVDVPKGLNVIGKIGDYYYSEVLGDEETMKLWIYRFRL